MDELADIGFGRNRADAQNAASPTVRKGSKRKAFSLLALGLALFTYAMVFIYAMNRPFVRGKTTTCSIVRADRFCWRRQLFGYSIVEQGDYACWKLRVRTTEDILLLTQYRMTKRLEKLSDACDSFESCGSYSPTCRLNDRENLAILYWRFPLPEFVLLILFSVFAFALALWQLHLCWRRAPPEPTEEDRVALTPRSPQCADEASESSFHFEETEWDATVQ